MLSICFLASGALGFKVLRHTFLQNKNIVAVFTDKKSTEVQEFCIDFQIPFFVGNPRKGRAAEFIEKIDCDVLLSVNYLFIVERDIIRLPRRYAINLHGSLLPKYRGRTPHVWAIINGEKETGITAHLMEDEVDNGAIVHQVKIKIEPEDTGADILRKFNKEYPLIIDEVLKNIENHELQLRPQDNTKAFYVGKRTPADGRINWDWDKERIYNWIRAQAKPYPGAFTFLEQEKITIHKASFENMRCIDSEANGTVLGVNNKSILVKTQDGVLRLEEFEYRNSTLLKEGMILN